MTGTYLGIDVGTSSVKAVLLDEQQTLLTSATFGLSVSRPHPGWSEQEPDDWWVATLAAVDELAASHAELVRTVRGIGLSGQMHGATLLGDDDKPLRPAILWNDGRSGAACAEMEAACPELRDIAGNIAMPGFTAPKLAWVRKHEPDVFEKIRRVLLPKDYVRLHLTGETISDMSDSAGTLWLDVAKRDWSDALLAVTGLNRSHMPSLVEGSAPGGKLRAALASRWGMSEAPVVAGGGGDNAASACGIGAVSPGQAFVSLGTSGVLFVSNARFSPNTDGAVHAFCHAVPDTWHQMGVILSAADSLEWLARIAGTGAPDLTAEVDDSVIAPSPVTFLPYLSGERTPHNDPGACGVFSGLTQTTSRADMTQAVLEGVSFAFADCLSVLEASGANVERAAAIGGGSRSSVWLKILSAAMNRPLDILKDGDFGGAFGAARLAICAAEGADPLEVCAPQPVIATIDPAPALADAYAARLVQYRALYPAIKEATQT